MVRVLVMAGGKLLRRSRYEGCDFVRGTSYDAF